MKPQDFDFRLYVVSAKDYVCDEDKYQILADLKAKSEFMERNALKEPQVEVELFTGFYDKNGTKIYEGDIIAHCVDGGGVEYHSKIEFNQQRGMFELVCIEHPVISDFSSPLNPSIEVIGNIHENPELL